MNIIDRMKQEAKQIQDDRINSQQKDRDEWEVAWYAVIDQVLNQYGLFREDGFEVLLGGEDVRKETSSTFTLVVDGVGQIDVEIERYDSTRWTINRAIVGKMISGIAHGEEHRNLNMALGDLWLAHEAHIAYRQEQFENIGERSSMLNPTKDPIWSL